MIIPDICNVLSTSGKEFSLSHWYSPIIDSWVTKIEVQRKHLFQIFRIYWIDSLFNMQVFWDLWIQWSNCPYFVAKKDLHWIYLVKKGKSGYSCQDAKFRSTPRHSLLLWAEKTREQNTCKSDLNRIMTERPNICYIFEKLSVQGCQIWHSHVSIPFNSAPAHSTRPHNAKKALYVIISAEIPEN